MEGYSNGFDPAKIPFKWPEELQRLMAAFTLIITVIILLTIWPLFSGKPIKFPVTGSMAYLVLFGMLAILIAILYLRKRHMKDNEELNFVLNFLYENDRKMTVADVENGLGRKTKNSVPEILRVLTARGLIYTSTSEDEKTTLYEANKKIFS